MAAGASPSTGVRHSHDTASLERSRCSVQGVVRVLCAKRVPEAVSSLPSVL